MKPTGERNILIALLLFHGLSAIGVGLLLIISPSGKLVGGLPYPFWNDRHFMIFLFQSHFKRGVTIRKLCKD